MNTKKLLALIMVLAMVLCLAACAPADDNSTPASTDDPVVDNTGDTGTDDNTGDNNDDNNDDQNDEPVIIEDGDVSITFDDGNYGFVTVYDGRANADASTLEIVEINGNKALKITNQSGKVPYVAFDVWSLLGENAANVASVEMMLGIENPDGKFYACSGSLILWNSGKLSSTTHDWSVYLENKNPKTATFKLGEDEAISETDSVVVLTLSTDNGATAGAANANLYVYNVTFKDASGNILTADSSATFNAPEGFSGSKDMSNLKYLKNTVSLDGMAGISGGGWAQNGVEMTEEFIAALVPGSVVEIEYSSTSGDLWIVMPDAGAGWSRIAQQQATKNNSKGICQITYEQFVAVLGEDVSTWGARLQCESDTDWQVYSVKVGLDSGLVTTVGKTDLEITTSGDGWAQNGIELTEEQWAMFVPGTVLEVTYGSESGELWVVLPWADAGWSRIEQQTAACDGSTMQITWEQMAAVCGDDVSAWGTMLQFESDTAWEVYSVAICSGAFINTTGNTELEGFACTGSGWGQNGFELTEEQWALMAPGAVITVKYTSASGDLWIVLPDASAGWSRVEQQTAICDGETMQITYEQIAAVCGDDVSAWGARLQFEASDAWEVYSVSIGMAA